MTEHQRAQIRARKMRHIKDWLKSMLVAVFILGTIAWIVMSAFAYGLDKSIEIQDRAYCQSALITDNHQYFETHCMDINFNK